MLVCSYARMPGTACISDLLLICHVFVIVQPDGEGVKLKSALPLQCIASLPIYDAGSIKHNAVRISFLT